MSQRKSLKSVAPKISYPIKKEPSTYERYDPKKFSKLLLSHCRQWKRSLPDGEFLDILDDFANGKIQAEEQSGTDEDATQVIDESPEE